MPDLYKYGVAVHVYKPIIKRGVVDFAVGADWTPVAGDVKISKDGGAAANVTNLPTAIAMGNTAMWDFSLTATEMQAKQIRITVSDSATKAVEDVMIEIDTYGNASAQHAVDLNDSVRAGLTALPNAAAEAAGGLFTRGSGAGQINQPANGLIDANVTRFGGTAGTFVAGRPEVNASHVAGTAQTARDLGAQLDVAVSTRLASASYTAPLDAAGTRSAVGLASANLDTQLGAIAGYIDTEIGTLQTTATAIKAKTDNLPASPAAVGSAMTLTAAYDFAKGTVAVTESYAANGVAPTPVQALLGIHQMLMQFAIGGTSYTVKKLDNTTTAFVVTLDDATNPTGAART